MTRRSEREAKAKGPRPGDLLIRGLSFVALIDLCSTKYPTGVNGADLRSIRDEAARAQTKTNDTSPDAAQTNAPRKKWTRLSGTQRREVIARYQAGEHTTALAKEYDVAKATILGVLRDSNIVVRRQPLTPDQIARAVQLYADGNSVATIGEALHAGSETIRRALIAEGEKLRPRPGRG